MGQFENNMSFKANLIPFTDGNGMVGSSDNSWDEVHSKKFMAQGTYNGTAVPEVQFGMDGDIYPYMYVVDENGQFTFSTAPDMTLIQSEIMTIGDTRVLLQTTNTNLVGTSFPSNPVQNQLFFKIIS